MKAADKKRNLSDMTLDEMDKLWDEAKREGEVVYIVKNRIQFIVCL